MNPTRRVLLVQGAHGEAYEPAWQRALAEIGVEVHLFNAHEHTLPGVAGRIERRLLWGPGIERLRRGLLSAVRQLRPDVTLLYQGHYFDPDFIRQLCGLSFVAGYHNDDPFGPQRGMLRYRHLLRALPHYDCFHVYRPANIEEAQRHGQPQVGLLMPYFLPWADFPRPQARSDPQWACDVVFAGHAEPDGRAECLAAAMRPGRNVRIHGQARYWHAVLPPDAVRTLAPIRPVFGEAYRQAISGAKVAACFFSKVNRDVYTRRAFEIPACGTLLLSERTDAMQDLYREGVEADYFSSAEEFASKVDFYLRTPAVRQRVADAGHRRVRAGGHDIHSRMRQWLGDVDDWRGASKRRA